MYKIDGKEVTEEEYNAFMAEHTVILTVEDFGGADKAREWWDKVNSECCNEIQECYDYDDGEFYDDVIGEYLFEVLDNSDDDDLPKAVVDKLNLYHNDDDGEFEFSDDLKQIALVNAREYVDDDDDDCYGDFDDYDDDDDDSEYSDEAKACHEILAVLKKYDVEIRGDELGGVWIGHSKIS